MGAIAGSDYAAASGDVIVAAGQIAQTFTVAVLGDRIPESTEYFVVNLIAATYGSIVDSKGWGMSHVTATFVPEMSPN